MTSARKQLIWRWMIGSFIGTLIVAFSTPLFVRSYLPRPLDPVRGVTTMASEHTFRWRSEGWATTYVGPHGMPGRRDLPKPDSRSIRLAIWGDSQAEGVCVADDQKLHAQIERAAREAQLSDPTLPSIVGLPLGRSGDDAADWLGQISPVEKALSAQVHVLLVTEIADLDAALGPTPETEIGSRMESLNARLVQMFPMFVIHTMRSLMTTDGYTQRQLRFSVGPIQTPPAKTKSDVTADRVVQWTAVFRKFTEVTQRPVVIVYAPPVPNITDGRVVSRDPDAREFDRLASAARRVGISVLDLRDEFERSSNQGQWPFGFHNGVIGSGHINSVGYRLIAHAVANEVPQIATEWE